MTYCIPDMHLQVQFVLQKAANKESNDLYHPPCLLRNFHVVPFLLNTNGQSIGHSTIQTYGWSFLKVLQSYSYFCGYDLTTNLQNLEFTKFQDGQNHNIVMNFHLHVTAYATTKIHIPSSPFQSERFLQNISC